MKLTKRAIEAADPPEGGSVWLRDADVKGLYLRAWRAGGAIARAYVVKWPDGRGGTKTATLGHHGGAWRPDPVTGAARILTLELAREEALRVLGARVDGGDPRLARGRHVGVLTLRSFASRYLAEWAVRKAPRTQAEEAGLLERHLLRVLGDERLAAIGPAHVSRLQAALGAHRVTANRARALLSAMLNVAKTWGELPASYVNPCPAVPPFPEVGRERPLTVDELARVGPALVAEERRAPVAVAAIRTLMLTGARPVEVLPILRGQLAAARATGVILQESRKTSQRRRPLYVNPLALAVMEAVPEVEGNEHVFPGEVAGAHITHSGVAAAWERVAIAAGVPDVRLYDAARHTFGTVAAMVAKNAKHVQDLLGHADMRTTQKYVHLAGAGVLGPAGDETALTIGAALERRPEGTRKPR